jgi:hypothetical protein
VATIPLVIDFGSNPNTVIVLVRGPIGIIIPADIAWVMVVRLSAKMKHNNNR